MTTILIHGMAFSTVLLAAAAAAAATTTTTTSVFHFYFKKYNAMCFIIVIFVCAINNTKLWVTAQ